MRQLFVVLLQQFIDKWRSKKLSQFYRKTIPNARSATDSIGTTQFMQGFCCLHSSSSIFLVICDKTQWAKINILRWYFFLKIKNLDINVCPLAMSIIIISSCAAVCCVNLFFWKSNFLRPPTSFFVFWADTFFWFLGKSYRLLLLLFVFFKVLFLVSALCWLVLATNWRISLINCNFFI